MYGKCIQNFILAKINPLHILMKFPDFLIPGLPYSTTMGVSSGMSGTSVTGGPSTQTPTSSTHSKSSDSVHSSVTGISTIYTSTGSHSKLTGTSLHYAAQAITLLCEQYRDKYAYYADKAQEFIFNTATTNNNITTNSNTNNSISPTKRSHSNTPTKSGLSALFEEDEQYENEEENNLFYISNHSYLSTSTSSTTSTNIFNLLDTNHSINITKNPIEKTRSKYQQQLLPEEIVQKAEIIDYAYLVSLVYSVPINLDKIKLLVLLKNCRCPLEPSSRLLASQGVKCIEILLSLYKTRQEHMKLLTLLNENRFIPSMSYSSIVNTTVTGNKNSHFNSNIFFLNYYLTHYIILYIIYFYSYFLPTNDSIFYVYIYSFY